MLFFGRRNRSYVKLEATKRIKQKSPRGLFRPRSAPCHVIIGEFTTTVATMRLDQMTIDQARAISAFSPGAWTLSETPEGWIARRGSAVLISSNSRKVRHFATVDTAIRRLRSEAGVKNFNVEAAPMAA